MVDIEDRTVIFAISWCFIFLCCSLKSDYFDLSTNKVVRLYNTKNTPVYSVFLDASKAFDQVNHAMLFRKLMAQSIPGCLLRLLRFRYTIQTMMIKWCNCISDSSNVSNGVRQSSVLSPYLFALYMDILSCEPK